MSKPPRTKLLDRSYNVRDAQLFIIAVEGAKTEERYFEIFRNPRIKVKVIPTGEGNDSAPQHVIKRLNKFAQEYDFGPEDALWLVLDVDRWGDKILSEVCREAKQKGYGLAISNPCFETWLCLHFDDLNPSDRTCRDFTKRLRLILGGYNKKNLDTDSFKERISDAIQRAKSIHSDENQLWPPTLGSHVYRVVETILAAMQPLESGKFSPKIGTWC